MQRIAVKTGESMRVQGALKPAFALLTAGSGLQAGVSDRRADVERALAGSRQVTVFAPCGREADEALKGQQMPSEWLAFDAGRRPLGGAAALNAAARRDLSTRFARALDVQGIAAISSQPSPSSPDLVVALIAAGAGEPDVVAVTPERTDSINRAIARFDYRAARCPAAGSACSRPTSWTSTVTRGGAGGSREHGRPGGDQAGGRAGAGGCGGAITGSAQLQQAARLEAAGGRGVGRGARRVRARSRTVQVPVAESPRLDVGVGRGACCSIPFRWRCAAAWPPPPPEDQPFVRLNLAVALMRLGGFAAAREQLEGVQLPAWPGDLPGYAAISAGPRLRRVAGDAAFRAAFVPGRGGQRRTS